MLVGRDGELATVSDLLRRDHPVAVVGEAGIGKTALLHEALASVSGGAGAPAGSGRRRVLVGGGLASLSWMDYGPLARAVGERRLSGDAAQVADRVRSAVGADGVLALDDLHWADAGTLDVVELLAPSVTLAVTVRAHEPGADELVARLHAAAFEIVPVGPLPEDDAADLVRLINPDASRVVVARLVRRCAGVPLLLTQLAGPEGEEAESLRIALASRLGGVSSDARELFELLSAVGRPVRLGEAEAAGELERAGLVTREESGAVAVLHAVLADLAVAALPPDRARELHRRAAELVADPGEAARHLEAAGELDRARDLALSAAAGVSRAGGSPAELAAHLAVAARCSTDAYGDALRLRAAAALVDALRHADAVAILDEVTGSDPATLAEAAILRSRALWYLGDDDGFRAAVHAAVVQGQLAGREVRARALVERSRIPIFLDPGMTPDGVTLATEALDAAREAGIPVGRAEMLLGLAHYMADRPEWQSALDAALRIARSEDDRDTELLTANNLVTAHESSGDPSVARRLAQEMVERTGAAGLVGWQLQFRAMLLNLDLHAADYAAVVSQAVELLDEPLDRRARGQVTSALLLALIDVGRLEVASDRLEELGRGADGALVAPESVRWLQSEAALHGGRPRDARDRAREAVDLGFADPFAPLVAVWASVDLGEPPDLLDDHPAPMFHGVRAESLGAAALVRGDHREAIAHLDAAAGSWRAYHRRGELRCRWGAAEAARRAGQPDDARRRLMELEAELAARDMQPMLARVRRSLRTLGVRRGKGRARREPDGLTRREREVMSLVAGGLSNAEIGRRLGLSRSTVTETVARAVDVLGAASRGQAAARLS